MIELHLLMFPGPQELRQWQLQLVRSAGVLLLAPQMALAVCCNLAQLQRICSAGCLARR